MQKKIIAVAVAALASTAAFAQTNVTVYGVADLGQAFVKSSGSADNQGLVGRLDNNSSYIGFKGVEDLGNGLKAVFQFEMGYNSDDGAGTTKTGIGGGRDSYIGLAGGFGTVVAGNLTHPLRAFGVKVELVPGAAGFGSTASVTGTIAGIKTGADDRAANAVAYVSPSFSGFTGVAAYVNGESRTNATATDPSYNKRAWQLAGQYENGPLFAGLGYHSVKDDATSIPDGFGLQAATDARVIRAVVSYTLPSNTKLTGLFDSTKVKDADLGAGQVDVKRNAFSLGVAQGFGKNTVGLEYAQSMKYKVDGASEDNTGIKMATLVYTYEMSKRTMLHARYSKLANQSAINQNFYNNPVKNGETTGVGSDYAGFMVGVRHSF